MTSSTLPRIDRFATMRSRLLLLACCIGAMTVAASPLAVATPGKHKLLHYPADVTRTTAPGYEEVQKMPHAAFDFKVKAIRVNDSLIELPGVLTTAGRAQTVVLWDFYFAPPPQIERRPAPGPPMPPPVPPPAMMFTVPANTSIEFVARLLLSDYQWKGSPTIDLPWTFDSWNAPRPRGVVRVKLPPR